MRSRLSHPAAVARGTDAAALAREGHDKTLPARGTACPAESKAENATGEVRPQLPFDVRRDGLLDDRPILKPAFEVLCDDLVERRPLRPASLVAAGTCRAAVWADFGPRRRRGECSDHGRTGAWAGEVCARTLLRRHGRCERPSPEPPCQPLIQPGRRLGAGSLWRTHLRAPRAPAAVTHPAACVLWPGIPHSTYRAAVSACGPPGRLQRLRPGWRSRRPERPWGG